MGLWREGNEALEVLQERRRSSKKRDEHTARLASNPVGAVANLASLEVLTEETMLESLRARLVAGSIYSYVGDVLVSLNPFAPVPLYGADRCHYYSLNSPLDNLEDPHVYAIALQAFRALARTRENQSCVISGESGAGKTETAKYFVGHLLELSRTENVGMTYKYDVLQFTMNSLLEPFGNARMRANHNSSRFGKYVGIQFDASNEIVGARMDHYLLEKSRVVNQLDGEQSFHIFYFMLEGLDLAALTALNLSRDVNKFSYLNGGYPVMEHGPTSPPPPASASSRKAARSFSLLTQQMQECGFQLSDLDGMYAVLAVVLHLGNINFAEESKSKTAHYFDLAVTGPIKMLAGLLGSAVDDLANALVTNIMVMRGETIVLRNTMSTAEATRDAVAKALYSRMFSWLVNHANRLMTSSRLARGVVRPAEIGVLDIFGFENLATNGLEQLCINVANEQLQNYFNASVFAWQADAMAKEGIAMEEVAYTDNTRTMQLFVTMPIGLFALLDEETRFPNASDVSLLDKLNHNLSIHPAFVPVLGKEGLRFAVNHYAGSIEYSVDGWLEKNKDTLTPSMTSLLRDSKISMIAELFSLSQTSTGGLAGSEDASKLADRQKNARALIRTLRQSVWKKSGDGGPKSPKSPKGQKRGLRRVDSLPKITLSITQRNATLNSLTGHFKASLIDLMTKLLSSNPHFIRCIRPNGSSAARTFEHPTVLTQLRHTGLLETVKIRRDGFSTQIKFSDFISRYQVLNHRLLDMVPASAESCKNILVGADLPPTQWQVGKTKVFIKHAGVKFLHEKLEEAQQAAARAVAIARMLLANRNLVRFRQAERARAEARRQQEERREAERVAKEREALKQAETIRKTELARKMQAAREAEAARAAAAEAARAAAARAEAERVAKEKEAAAIQAALAAAKQAEQARASKRKADAAAITTGPYSDEPVKFGAVTPNPRHTKLDEPMYDDSAVQPSSSGGAMERARDLAAGDSDSRLARKPSGDYGFSGSDTETFGFGNDFSPSPVQVRAGCSAAVAGLLDQALRSLPCMLSTTAPFLWGDAPW